MVKSAKASRFSFADMVKETITVTDEPVKGASRCVIAKYLGPSTPQSLLLSNNASVTSSMFVTPRPIAFAATTFTASYGLMKSTRGCEVMYVVLCELALFVALSFQSFVEP